MELPPPVLPVDLTARIRAALVRRPHGVIAGVAAASRWEAWEGEVPVVDVHVGRRGGRARDGVRCHHEGLRDDEVVEHEGLRWTTPGRTAYDVLRWAPAPDAVAVADRLAHRHGVDAGELRGLSARHSGTPGNQAIRDRAGMTNPRSRTPAVSRVRVAMVDDGLRAPEVRPSVAVGGRDGVGFALPDLAWTDDRVAVFVGGERLSVLRDALLLQRGGWTVAFVAAPAAGDRDALDRAVRTVRGRRIEARRRALGAASGADDLEEWEVEEWDDADA